MIYCTLSISPDPLGYLEHFTRYRTIGGISRSNYIAYTNVVNWQTARFYIRSNHCICIKNEQPKLIHEKAMQSKLIVPDF